MKQKDLFKKWFSFAKDRNGGFYILKQNTRKLEII
jgi:hypothetical protein